MGVFLALGEVQFYVSVSLTITSQSTIFYIEELGIKILCPVETKMTHIDFSIIGWKPEDWLQKCNKLGWKTEAQEENTRLCTHY